MEAASTLHRDHSSNQKFRFLIIVQDYHPRLSSKTIFYNHPSEATLQDRPPKSYSPPFPPSQTPNLSTPIDSFLIVTKNLDSYSQTISTKQTHNRNQGMDIKHHNIRHANFKIRISQLFQETKATRQEGHQIPIFAFA